MYFLIEGEELLKTNDIWNKVRNSIKKEFDSEFICNKIFLKTKTESDGREATDFHDKEIAKVGSNYAWLAVILIDFVLTNDDNFYPQVFLKECKYIEKKKSLLDI